MSADARAALRKYQITVATARQGDVSHIIRADNVEAAKDMALRAHPKGQIGVIRCLTGEA